MLRQIQQKSNQNLLVTANTTINGGVYDTIVIEQNLTVNFDGFVVAKKLIIENNANVNVNGVLIVDEIQCDRIYYVCDVQLS